MYSQVILEYFSAHLSIFKHIVMIFGMMWKFAVQEKRGLTADCKTNKIPSLMCIETTMLFVNLFK